MKSHNGVWILGEFLSDHQISGSSLDLVHSGKEISRSLAEPLSLVCLGKGIDTDKIQAAGFDQVYLFDDPGLEIYHPQRYVDALVELAREQGMPRLVLAPHSLQGRDLLPILAVRLNTRAVTDSISISLDKENQAFLMTKPVFGGNIMANLCCRTLPALVTLRPGGGKTEIGKTGAGPRIISCTWSPGQNEEKLQIVEQVRDKTSGIRLEEASTIVSGGKGMGSTEGFEMIKQAAALLNGGVGSTRPACDSGWTPSTTQIGITGKIVAPDLYLAVAISGMMQHLTGMSASGHVVAINSDPKAPIFKYADFGVVGDYQEVLPAFMDTLKTFLPDTN